MATKTKATHTLAEAKALRAGEGRCLIAVGDYTWARAETGGEALKAIRKEGARKGSTVFLFDCPARTQVSGMGSFTYFPPEGKTWDDVPDFNAYTKSEQIAVVRI